MAGKFEDSSLVVAGVAAITAVTVVRLFTKITLIEWDVPLVLLLTVLGVYVVGGARPFVAGSRSAAVQVLHLGMMIFAVAGIGGAVALTTISGCPDPRSTVKALTIGAVVALYTVGMLALRRQWALRPTAQGLLAGYPEIAASPLPIWSDGYLMTPSSRIVRAEFARIEQIGENATELAAYARRVMIAAAGTPACAAASKALTEALKEKSPSLPLVKGLCRDLVETYVLHARDKVLALSKIQNMLLVLTLMLLAVVAIFSTLSWTTPMLVAATTAVIFRIRDLTPAGKTFDGSIRWMAVMLTPLVGAASAVVGLLVLAALFDVGVLSADLGSKLAIPGLSTDGIGAACRAAVGASGGSAGSGSTGASALLLGVAGAFGYSAKLLDTLLDRITAYVDKKPGEPTDSSGKAPSPQPDASGAQVVASPNAAPLPNASRPRRVAGHRAT